MTITVSTAAAVEPLTLGDVKDHLQVEHTADDTHIRALIAAARAIVENYTGRALVQRTVAIDLDANEAQSPIELPLGKLQSVSSFVYYDTDGNSTAITSSDYYIAATNPGRLVAKNSGWYVQRSYKAVTVTAVVGYGASGDNVPDDILHALRLIVADLWHNETSDEMRGRAYPIPMLAELLLAPYRLITPLA